MIIVIKIVFYLTLPSAATVEVAQVVGEGLQIIRVEVAVVPEDVVVAGPGGALDPLVGHQVEVALGGVVDALVDHRAGESVTVLVFVLVGWKESRRKEYDGL